MSMEALTSVSGKSYPAPEIPRIQPTNTLKQDEIESEIKSEGAKAVGDDAFLKAFERIKKMMTHKNIEVDNYVDKDTGIKQIIFKDTETGKVIKQMPVDAVIEIVEKANAKIDSWLFDKTV